MNRLNGQYFKKWAKVWRKYFDAQGEKLLEHINDPNPYITLFEPTEVERIFSDMYKDVGVGFAKVGIKNVKGAEPYTEATIRYWEMQMAEYAVMYGAESIVSISQSGKKAAQAMIKSLTEAALLEGISNDYLEDYIEKYIPEEWRIAGKFQAERIARTETHAAANFGNYQGAKSSGVATQKQWLTVLDGREREEHAMADGQRVDIDAPFIVGGDALMVPGGKGGRAGNVINCRCQCIYLTEYSALDRGLMN